MKLLIFIFLLASHATYAQSLNGRFVALEDFPIITDIDGNPIYGKVGGKKFKQWFYEITITIKDSLVFVSKVPTYLHKGQLRYSTLESGFYYYSGLMRTTDSCFLAELLMDSCKGCPEGYQRFLPVAIHLDTALVLQKRRLETKDWGRHQTIFVSPLDDMTLNYVLCPNALGLLVNASYKRIQFTRKE